VTRVYCDKTAEDRAVFTEKYRAKCLNFSLTTKFEECPIDGAHTIERWFSTSLRCVSETVRNGAFLFFIFFIFVGVM